MSAPVLVPMTPIQQLRAGRFPERLIRLMIGLFCFGFSMAMLIRARLGLDPWDVFHQGITRRVGINFGVVVILTSFVVLLLWIPLRQWPGLGTVCNAVLVGLSCNVGLAWMSSPTELWARIALMAGAVVLNGFATGLYVGAQLGPGPRDGLFTGVHQRTGVSIRLIRTSIEIAVLAIGWILGGQVGVGTVVYALGIGPIVHVLLPRLTVRVPHPPPAAAVATADRAGDDSRPAHTLPT